MAPRTGSRSALFVGWLINAALVVLAIAFVGVLVKKFLFQPSNLPDEIAPTIEIGGRLDTVDVDWEKRDYTLVFGLSTACHFCTESGAFYREIVQRLKGRSQIQLIALFPEPASEGREYLQNLGVSIGDIRKTNLRAHGFAGTPTLLLIDRAGVVTDLWVGKLGVNMQTFVMERLDNPGGPNRFIEVSALRQDIEQGITPVILDIENRNDYIERHIVGARNIPLDELETRAENELPHGKRIILYGHGDSDNLTQRAFEILIESGFRNAVVLKGGLKEWRRTENKGQ